MSVPVSVTVSATEPGSILTLSLSFIYHVFNKIHLMVESTAAAMAYGLLVVGTKTVLVFDMGGGECHTLSFYALHITIAELFSAYTYSITVALTLSITVTPSPPPSPPPGPYSSQAQLM